MFQMKKIKQNLFSGNFINSLRNNLRINAVEQMRSLEKDLNKGYYNLNVERYEQIIIWESRDISKFVQKTLAGEETHFEKLKKVGIELPKVQLVTLLHIMDEVFWII